MKMKKQLIAAAWLALSSQAMADNFTIADFSIQPGETKTISVELNNPDNEYMAFEFYMSLPEGVSILEDEDGYLLAELNGSRFTEDFELSASRLDDGTYRFICFSIPFTSLIGTSGEILTMTVTASEAADHTAGEGRLFSQVLSTPDKTQVVFEDFAFNVSVGSQEGYCPHGFMLGDMNGDHSLSVSDVMALVGMVTGTMSEVTCPQGCSLGDMNGDHSLSVSDVMVLVGMVTGN